MSAWYVELLADETMDQAALDRAAALAIADAAAGTFEATPKIAELWMRRANDSRELGGRSWRRVTGSMTWDEAVRARQRYERDNYLPHCCVDVRVVDEHGKERP